MFSKFKIEDFSPADFVSREVVAEYIKAGKKIFADNKREISASLDAYVKANGHLDADKLSGDWFQIIDADVFISHSHADERLALLLAGYLQETYGLKSFIDSTIWGNIRDLQREVDRPLYNATKRTYSYEGRNQSTAYVHLLLSTALTKMIDNSEALFFLSSPHSINSIEDNITSSVWIYHELVTSTMLRQKYPGRTSLLQKCFSGGVIEGRIQDGYTMDFKIDLSDFQVLDGAIIEKWEKTRHRSSSRIHSLDILYRLYDKPTENRKIYD